MSKKPEGIPEDTIPEAIWDVALEAIKFARPAYDSEEQYDAHLTGVARAILAAVEAEREACVKSLDELLTTYVPNDPERYGVEASVAAIRNRRGA